MQGPFAGPLPCVQDISLSGSAAAGHCLQLHAVMAMLCCLSSLRMQKKLTCVRGKHASDGGHASLAGKNLQAQYERWQPRAKYKTHLDPTMDDVKKLAISCRRTAKVRTQLGCAARPMKERCSLCHCNREAGSSDVSGCQLPRMA